MDRPLNAHVYTHKALVEEVLVSLCVCVCGGGGGGVKKKKVLGGRKMAPGVKK